MDNMIPPVLPTPAPRPQPQDILRDMVNFSGMQNTLTALVRIANQKVIMYREANNTYYADTWEDMAKGIAEMQAKAPRL